MGARSSQNTRSRFGGGPGRRGIRIRIGAGLCVLAWALSLSPAASCAAAENADRSRSVGAGTSLREMTFEYSQVRGRLWPVAWSVELSCTECARALESWRRSGEGPVLSRGGAAGHPVPIGSPSTAADERSAATWRVLLTVHLASVVADVYTTSRALDAGATEANPMYSWADDRTALAARMALGGGLTWMLHRLHSDSPRLARALALVAIVANLVTSGSNEHVSRAARPAVPDR